LNNRRRHFKVELFPKDLVEAINNKLADGWTYARITDYINKEGYAISDSAIERYGKNFNERLRQIKLFREQAKAIISETGDRPATEAFEAANTLATQLITESLLDVNKGQLEKEKLTDIFRALAQISKSAASLEGVKVQANKKMNTAFKKLRTRLERDIEKDPELLDKVLKHLDEVKKEMDGEDIA